MRKSSSPKKRFGAPSVNLKLETLKRIAIFSIATLLLGTAQCSFFSALDVCPRTPNLVMGLILAAALCDGAKTAAVLSVGAGFFIDAIGGGALSLSPVIYFGYAVIISLASQKMLKGFPSFVLLLLPSLLYGAAATTLLALLNGSAALDGSLAVTLLLEALCTFVLCLPVYPLINLATKPLSSRKKFSF